MKREQFTEKLIRMIETIKSGTLPVRVSEFYVFGSYARGALQPGDLDILVLHDKPSRTYLEALLEEAKEAGYSGTQGVFRAGRRFEAAMRDAAQIG